MRGRRDNSGEGGGRILAILKSIYIYQQVKIIQNTKKCPFGLLKVVIGQFSGHFLDTLKILFFPATSTVLSHLF